jgi:hypothetical protein
MHSFAKFTIYFCKIVIKNIKKIQSSAPRVGLMGLSGDLGWIVGKLGLGYVEIVVWFGRVAAGTNLCF